VPSQSPMALKPPRFGMSRLHWRDASEKTRLQLQGELQAKDQTKRVYRGVLHGYGVILKNEGFKGLMRGLNCAVGLPVVGDGC
jgi:hypothetical protein